MMDRYILDNEGNPKVEEDLMVWGQWMRDGNRRVARTQVGNADVSTVFLGLDHGWPLDGDIGADYRPVLFETMVFMGDTHSEVYCDRYCTREEAMAGHARAVAMANGGTLLLEAQS